MEFGKILSHDTDLKLLLREASHYLAINMKAEYASFYLLNLGIYGNGQTKKANFRRKEINVLTGYVQAKLLGAEAVSEDMLEAGDAKEVLEKHKIKIFMPLMAQKEVFGYLLLGEHKSRGYSRRDLTVLNSIANELSIAIQNSMSVEEIRELNATLQQKIDDATNELRTKNRQLQRLDEVKDEFLSIASHQLRTPLTSIKGYVDMLLEGDFGEVSGRQREVLDDIFTSSERMVQLINDFLNVSRIQTGKFALERRPTDLEELIEKEIKLMSASLEQRNLKIDWQCDEMMPLLNVDTDKIRQVVVNMIDNAVYYSRPNSTIKVRLDKELDNLIFTVTDTGIGVPAKDQANLFGKFFRASNARKRRPDGTGVGLYLAKKIIDTHGGEIIFKSVEGEGSTFGFKLPLVA
jgi:signal transduction histidine kinase